MGLGVIPWVPAIYLSLLVWLATIAGNLVLFAQHPARHWPLLETVEGLQLASLIPVAFILHRINKRSPRSAVVTIVGVLAMLLGVVVDAGFVSELLTYGKGSIAVVGFNFAVVGVLVWLLAANVLAWRGRTVPSGLALVGIASALTGTLLYPV